MTIEIPAEYLPFIQQALDRGDYGSEAELVAHGLELLRQQAARLDQLRANLDEGLQQIESGDVTHVEGPTESRELVERIKQRGRERLQEESRGG